jgi:5-methylcytosine-specific restriction endonuclease McrA
MPIASSLGLSRLAKPLTSEEGNRILERDHYQCRYCGLDGLASFENSLVMTVDFVHPRARKGGKQQNNLVCACRPCNTIKGRRVFATFEQARVYVLQKRAELRLDWEMRTGRSRKSAGGST